MGGSIILAVRTPGQLRVVSTYTGLISDTATRRFIELDASIWDEWLEDGESRPLAPKGYGLFVVDYVTCRVLHMQGYANPCMPASWGFMTEDPFIPRSPSWPTPDVLWFVEQGRVKITRWRSDDFEDREEVLISSWEEGNRYQEGKGPHVYRFDLSPWVVERFAEDLEGPLAFRARLEELGFKLDHAAWEPWIQHKREDEMGEESEGEGEDW